MSAGIGDFARVAALVVLAVGCDQATVRPVPTVPIGELEEELAEPFTRIVSLVELSNADVIVFDAVAGRSEVLYVVLPGGARRQIGRHGQGPQEYSQPVRLLAGRGDTTLLVERWSQRFVVIDRLGSIPGKVPALASEPDMADELGGVAPIARDTLGRLYHVPGELPRRLAHRRDSTPLVRYSTSAPHGDTIAWIGRTVGPTWTPYSPGDGWAVFPNGRVAIVRSPAYRIEWIAADATMPVPGPTIPYEPVPLTQADIDAVQLQVRGPLPPYLAQVQAQLLRPLDEWPPTKPPTITGAGGRGIFVRSHAEMWVALWPAAADSMQSYDVIDTAGVLVRRVRFPKEHRLVALTERHAYVVRRDSVDLEYLRRYRLADPAKRSF